MNGEMTYHGLDELSDSFAKSDFNTLEYFLRDVGGGINAFKMRLPEWIDWFHYLLPYLATRPDIDRLIGAAVMYLMNLYPEGIPAVYPEFRADVVNTLGKCLMSRHFWQKNDLSDRIVQDEYIYRLLYNDNAFIATLSPVLFCCLKYLNPDEIMTWVDSMAAIRGTHWQYNLLTWLHRAVILLDDYQAIRGPIKTIEHLNLHWPETHRLQYFTQYELIPEPNMTAFLEGVRRNRLLIPGIPPH